MRLFLIISFFLSSQVFAQSNVKLVSTNDITILADTNTSSVVLAPEFLPDNYFKVTSECFFWHDSLPYERTISKDVTFFMKTTDVIHTKLSDQELFALLKSDFLSLGGTWEGPGFSSNGPTVIKAPKNLKELTEKIESLGGHPVLLPFSTSIDLTINDGSQRTIKLSCNSTKHLSLNEIIDILTVKPEEIEHFRSLKIDTSF